VSQASEASLRNRTRAWRSSILTAGTRTPFHPGSKEHLDQEIFYFHSALNNALGDSELARTHEQIRSSSPSKSVCRRLACLARSRKQHHAASSQSDRLTSQHTEQMLPAKRERPRTSPRPSSKKCSRSLRYFSQSSAVGASTSVIEAASTSCSRALRSMTSAPTAGRQP